MGNDYRRWVGRRMLVQLDSVTIDGKLTAVTRRLLVLSDAIMIGGPAGKTPIDGEVLIHLDKIGWTQVVS